MPRRGWCGARGQSLTLTSGEFDMLALLLRHAGEVVTRAAISQQAMGRKLLPPGSLD